jgi:hypothetical protein
MRRGVKSEMANPDSSGCTVNFTDGYLPPVPATLIQAQGQDVLSFPFIFFKIHLLYGAFKKRRKSDNFPRGSLGWRDKAGNGGGENINDARLRGGKNSFLI